MIAFENILILVLRVFGMLLKALFLFFSAKYLSITDFGKLALINTGISLMLSLMGISFYNFTNRLLVEGKDIENTIVNHFLIIFSSGFVSFAILPLFVIYGGIEMDFIWKFAAILFLEHLINEFFLVLIPLNKSVTANILHTLRICCAFLLPMVYIWRNPDQANLQTILSLWISSLAILVFIAVSVTAYWIVQQKKQIRIDSYFFKQGLKTSIIFLLVSFLGKACFTLDKFVLNHFHGNSEVGVYNFFYSLAWTIPTLVETSLVTPSLYTMLKTNELKSVLYRLIRNCFLMSLTFIAGFAVCGHLILKLLNKEFFEKDISLFYVFAFAGMIYSIGQSSMMSLYALKKDKSILKAYLFTFICFLIASVVNNSSKYSIAWNMVFTCIMLLVSNFYLFKHYENK